MAAERAMDELQTMKAAEAAKLLGMHPVRLYREARAGRVPCIRIGKSVRFRRAKLLEWMEEQERQGGVAGEERQDSAAI